MTEERILSWDKLVELLDGIDTEDWASAKVKAWYESLELAPPKKPKKANPEAQARADRILGARY